MALASDPFVAVTPETDWLRRDCLDAGRLRSSDGCEEAAPESASKMSRTRRTAHNFRGIDLKSKIDEPVGLSRAGFDREPRGSCAVGKRRFAGL